MGGKQSTATAITTSNISAQSVNYANSTGTAATAAKLGRGGNASLPMTFHLSVQEGQPAGLWGGNDGTNMYVYNPANFNVNYANGAELSRRTHGLLCSPEGTTGKDLYIAVNGKNVSTYGWDGLSRDGLLNLGYASNRFGQIYSTNSVISTSDRTLKNNINPLEEKHLHFFQLLQPVSFTFINGSSGRTHIGFIAQDVEIAMKKCGLSDLDFAGFCKDPKLILHDDGTAEPVLDSAGNPTYIYSLRYEEFIAVNTFVLQAATDEIKSLNDRVIRLESLMTDNTQT